MNRILVHAVTSSNLFDAWLIEIQRHQIGAVCCCYCCFAFCSSIRSIHINCGSMRHWLITKLYESWSIHGNPVFIRLDFCASFIFRAISSMCCSCVNTCFKNVDIWCIRVSVHQHGSKKNTAEYWNCEIDESPVTTTKKNLSPTAKYHSVSWFFFSCDFCAFYICTQIVCV